MVRLSVIVKTRCGGPDPIGAVAPREKGISVVQNAELQSVTTPKTLSPYSSLLTAEKVKETHLPLHFMKMYRGEELRLHLLLTLTLDGGKRPASGTGHFTPGERLPVPTE